MDSLDCYYWQEAASQPQFKRSEFEFFAPFFHTFLINLLTNLGSQVVSNAQILTYLFKIQSEKNVAVITTISELYNKGASPSMTVSLDGTSMTLNNDRVEYVIDNVAGFCPRNF